MSFKDTDTRKSLPEFDARKLMEIAIAEMKKSVSEAREDKVPPAVGAVIWFPKENGTRQRIEVNCEKAIMANSLCSNENWAI